MIFFKKLTLHIIMVTIFLPLAGLCSTVNVSGIIGSDTTWTNSDTVIVTDSVTLPSASKLIIQAGTVVMFSPTTSLLIEGQLTAIGTGSDSIIFTSTADTTGGSPGYSDWGGIIFEDSSDVLPCLMDYCAVRHAPTGINIINNEGVNALQISNCEIKNCLDFCIMISSSDPVISNTVLKNCHTNALRAIGYASEITILNCEIYQESTSPYYKSNYGAYIDDAVTATFSGTSIHDFYIGLYINYDPTIYMTNCSIHDNAENGVYNTPYRSYFMKGYIRYSAIYGNGSYGFKTDGGCYWSASGVKIDAKYNYWGTTDGYEIQNHIYDYLDAICYPTVEYFPFLDSPDSATANIIQDGYLYGSYTIDTTLSIANSPYKLLGSVMLTDNSAMTVEPGVKLNIQSNFTVSNGSHLILNDNDSLIFDGGNLLVDGQLTALGSAGDSIVFTSSSDTLYGDPGYGDWGGIDFTSNSDNFPSVLDYCSIRYAVNGIYVYENQGPNALTISNSLIANSSSQIIYINNSDPSIIDCTIKNCASYAIAVNGAASEVTLLNCDIYQEPESGYYNQHEGIYLTNDITAIISGCLVHNFSTGITISYTPTLYMTNSMIYDNSMYGVNQNYYTSGVMDGYIRYCSIINNGSLDINTNAVNASSLASTYTINADYNWWGTTDGITISDKIYDFSDDNLSPLINYIPFLDGPDSATATPVITNYFQGDIIADSTLALTSSPYIALGNRIKNGATLTVEPGVKIIHRGNMLIESGSHLILNNNDSLLFDSCGLFIDGQLNAIGEAGDSIIFTSTTDSIGIANYGDWIGLTFGATSDHLPSVLDYCAIRYAIDGINIYENQGADALVLSNSEIKNCSDRCLEIANSDPVITGCTIKNAGNDAVFVTGSTSEPTLSSCNISQDAGSNYYRLQEGLYLEDQVTATVTNCSLHDFSTGVYLHYAPTIYMTNSSVYNNETYGIRNYAYNGSCMNGYINYCRIDNNSGYNLYANHNNTNLINNTIDASYNWWGVSDGAVIANSIYDYSNNNTYPVVEFLPFLDNPDSALANPISEGYIQGSLDLDTTLSLSGSPYQMVGVRVNNGATLSVDAGVKLINTKNCNVTNGSHLHLNSGDTLLFDSSSSLIIDGQLTAIGNETDSIIFSATSDSLGGLPAASDWEGIDFLSNSDNNPCLMDYCAVRYAVDGIYLSNNRASDDMMLSHSEISNCYNACLYIYQSDPSISNCTIKNGRQYNIYTEHTCDISIVNSEIYQDVGSSYYKTGIGIYYKNQYPTINISGSLIHDFATGVYIYYNGALYMTNCTISDNSYGFHNYAHYSIGAMQGYIRYSSILNNGSYGFYTTEYSYGYPFTIDAAYNWWGNTDSAAIADNEIYDILDDASRPTVQFSPFLTDPSLERCDSDFDFTGIVDHNDLFDLAYSFGSKPGYYNWNPICDISSIGPSEQRIDGLDLAILGSQFGQEGGCYITSGAADKSTLYDNVKIIIESDEKNLNTIYPSTETEIAIYGISFDITLDSSLFDPNYFTEQKKKAAEQGISFLTVFENNNLTLALVGLEHREVYQAEFKEFLKFDQTESIKLKSPVLFVDDYSVLLDPKIEYSKGSDNLPLKFALYQNYPNPFNPETKISFDLPQKASIKLEIYNLLGQKVWETNKDLLPAGRHTVFWNGTDQFGRRISSGVYFYKLEAGEYSSTRKMLLIK